MVISTLVAYRIYDLNAGKKAVLFHTRRKNYMFLERLSAELFEMILKEDPSRMTTWMTQNEITEEDVEDFKQQLDDFGVFSMTEQEEQYSSVMELQNEEEKEKKYNHILSDLQQELFDNGYYFNFHIDLTNHCNERCIHCYHPFDQYDYSKEMSFEDVCQLVDRLEELGVFSLVLSGGEALLRKDIFDIMEYISNKGMMITLFTNGVLLTEETVQKLHQYRIKLISISLYADIPEVHDKITAIKGSFERTLEGINRLKEHGIPFELKCVVLAENADRVEQIREFGKKINYGKESKLDFSLCGKLDGDCSVYDHRVSNEVIKKIFTSDPDRYIGSRELLQRSPKQHPCGAGRYGLYCSADGNIYPCVSFRLFLCNYRELDNIHTNTVLRRWLNTRISDFSECFKHDYCNYCVEQCAGNNLIENNDYLNSKISHCERAKIIADWFASKNL